MSDKTPSSVNPLQRVIAEIKRDKKRAAILGIVLAVGLLIGGKALIGGLPSKAAAAPSKKKAGDQQVAARTVPVKHSEARTAYLKGLHGNVTRDVFEIRPDCFASITKAPARAVATTTTAPVDRRRETIEDQAARLALQTVMYGSTSMVSIDGQLLRAGEIVKGSGFQIVEIKPASCVLVKEGVTVELKLATEDKK